MLNTLLNLLIALGNLVIAEVFACIIVGGMAWFYRCLKDEDVPDSWFQRLFALMMILTVMFWVGSFFGIGAWVPYR